MQTSWRRGTTLYRYRSRNIARHADLLILRIIPQFKSRCRPSVLPALANAIYSQPTISPDARARMARDLLVSAVPTINFYSDQGPDEYRTSAELAISFIETCLRCDCDDLLSKVLDRLMQGVDEQFGVETVLPVLSRIGEAAREYPANKSFPDVVPFAKWVVSSYLNVVAVLPDEVTAGDLISLCGALEGIGQPGLIESQ